MKIDKIKLQQALETVKPGLSGKEAIEQSTSFAFMQGRIVTYNDEISISHPVKDVNIEGAIQAEELYKFLNKIKKDEIELDVEKNEIILKAGRSKAGLTLQQEIKLPLEEITQPGKWKPLPENFIKHMRFAMSSCSRDMSRPVLTCVHVNSSGVIEGSDNNRIVHCKLEGEMPVNTFLILTTSVAELVKLNPTEIAESKGWMHFRTGEGTVISCRTFADEYPDTSPFLTVEGVEVHFPKSIIDILDRASVFWKREYFLDESVDVHIEKNRIRIKSQSDTGWFEEEANIRYDDEPIQFAITPYLLKDILSETLTCIISENALKFEGEGWLYVTTLLQNIK